MTEYTIAGQMQWTSALVDTWAGKGREPTDEMRHEALGLVKSLQDAGLVDCGDGESGK